MRIRILASLALVNEETDRRAGMYEEVDAPRERAEYLISIGAAEALNVPEKTDEDGDKDDEGDGGEQSPEAPETPAETAPVVEEKAPEPEPEPEPIPAPAEEKKAAPAAPARKPAPKATK